MNDDGMLDDIIANDPEVLESFVDESKTSLRAAESDLRALRNAPVESDPERLERTFRSVHSVKSAAGFLGLDHMAGLALCMEKLLDAMRKNTISPGGGRLEALLEGVGLLTAMIQDVQASSEIDTEPLTALLSEQLAAGDG
jgi:two-component system chemotaxis sensor kinase CheA